MGPPGGDANDRVTPTDPPEANDRTGSSENGVDKERIRTLVWDDLEERGVARFPFPPHDRIPNFEGAPRAADRLTEQAEWNAARTIKANPDAPQLPVRRRALRDGKTVYVAVPRLTEERCFLELDPDDLSPEDYDDATTVSGISAYGTPRRPDEVAAIDLIISGSVAVSAAPCSASESNGDSRETRDGARIGKGEGYSDLEFALLREFDRVDDETPVATTVHERQLVDEPFAVGDHDVSIDLIATPERVLRPAGTSKPTGIDWELLDEERCEEIPVLSRLSDR